MPVHVAILIPKYLRLILDGQKTIESRLTKTSRDPYHAIEPGERIFFKASSGPYMATAIADRVAFFQGLKPGDVQQLKAKYNKEICGEDDFWDWKADSNYATLICLREVQAVSVGPKMPPSRGVAWFVLPNHRAPAVFSITLTSGAIRNRYVRIAKKVHAFPPACYGGKTVQNAGKCITFELPDGDVIQSDLLDSGMVRSRKWSALFAACNVEPGDQLCFVQTGSHRYGVSVRKL